MTSEARLTANRANALRSTGPRSVEGKARSSLNAVRHGMRARQLLLSDEDPEQFDLLAERLAEALAPASVMEEIIVGDIAATIWRLRRVERVEAALFSIGMPRAVAQALRQAGQDDAGIGAAFTAQAGAFATLSKYEVALAGRLRRALADLQKLRSEREMGDIKLVVIDGER